MQFVSLFDEGVIYLVVAGLTTNMKLVLQACKSKMLKFFSACIFL